MKLYSKIWRVIFCLFLASSLFMGCGGGKQLDSSTGLQIKLDKTWSLAVFPFELAGKSDLSGEEAMNLVSAGLAGAEGFRIVDRAALEESLEKLGFELGKLTDPEARMKVGKLLGAQLICFGSVNPKLKMASARVNIVETGELLVAVSADGGKEIKNVNELAQKLRTELQSQKVVVFLNEYSKKPVANIPPPSIHQVNGYGAIIDGDLVAARKLALKDAYANAIEKGCGVKLTRKTQIENYQLVRDKILTESVGYVDSYEILDEKQNSESGYLEVTVRASVSQQPISGLDKLKLLVEYLYATPQIVVLIDGQIKGNELEKRRADVIAGQISSYLQKAGFLVVDAQTVTADSLDDEGAAQLGNMLGADLTVRGILSVDIVNRIEEVDGRKLNFPIIYAATTGVFRIIRAETAEIVLGFDQNELPPDSNEGSGNTDDAAIERSLNSFIQASADKLAWKLALKLGEPIQMLLELQNVTQKQAEQFEQQIQGMPKHIVVDASMKKYEENKAIYKVATSVKSQTLAQHIIKLIDPTVYGAKELIVEKIIFGSIIMSLK